MAQCFLIADFNAENMAALLSADRESPHISAVALPFGQVYQNLETLSSGLATREDFAFIWATPQGILSSFKSLSEFRPVDTHELLTELDLYLNAIIKASANVRALFVASFVDFELSRGWGIGDFKFPNGLALTMAQMNLRMAENLADIKNVFFLDTSRWITESNGEKLNPRLWYQAKIAFSNGAFRSAALDLKSAIRALSGHTKKLIVLDLDDTLWGGVVGDVGWENLKVGGHDPIGEAFWDFQRTLKGLSRRGVLLALVSKNTENIALHAIDNHPEMLLRTTDFAGWRINWRDKAANIMELAEELRLGLQSIVFIDENPIERDHVKSALDEVTVPEWPENPMYFTRALNSLRCFDTPLISDEDKNRSATYQAERTRRLDMNRSISQDDWLQSLKQVVTVKSLDETVLPRAVQLLNKTNQMNLKTRRLTEPEFNQWASTTGNKVWVFRVTDKFGDSGLTGLVSLVMNKHEVLIVDFILSCRVMGRKVEETMLNWIYRQALSSGASLISAELIPTAKNSPCREFLAKSGFLEQSENRYTWDLAEPYPMPEAVKLVETQEIEFPSIASPPEFPQKK